MECLSYCLCTIVLRLASQQLNCPLPSCPVLADPSLDARQRSGGSQQTIVRFDSHKMVSFQVLQGITNAFSFIGFVLVSVPLVWHLEAWNVGCVLYIIWTAIGCLLQFINSLAWSHDAVNRAPAWCDFFVRITQMASVGIPAASLVIARRLCKIATGTTVRSTTRDKQRAIMTDLAIGLSPPLASLVIYYFIQGHRFDILEGVGCSSAVPFTIPSFFLFFGWPIFLGVISAIYSGFTLRAFLKRRKQFSELIASNSNLTFNRYFRLMAMAVVEICCTVPLAIYGNVVNFRDAYYQYRGFADLHLGFDRVRQYPLALWDNGSGFRSAVMFNQWAFIGCALVFFLIFGVAEEARKHYRAAYTSVAKRVGLSTGEIDSSGFTQSKGSKITSSGFGRATIPTFIQPHTTKRDSMFSDRLSQISVGDFHYDDEKHPYSPTESSAGSSTYLGSPASEKGQEHQIPDVVEVPKAPEPIHNVDTVQRHTPDVPSAVRNSVDMV
ncbi:hypothetical protein QCA50_016167 [Cerrena zonata]|uniref:Pheromone receptor n=1 Tax=Cerrena zonata TaxID=2478898 RepID=A0AAW0FL27_9APHY